MFGIFQSKKNQFAVDIGSRYTKFIKVSRKSKQLTVDQFYMQPTPEKAFEAGNILNPDALVQFITQSVSQMDFAGSSNVVSGLYGKSLIIKKIDIPKIEESLIPEHLPFEVEQYVPYDLADMELDFEILKPSSRQSPDSMSVLFASALKETINSYSDIFEKSFLTCDVLDVSTFALANAFEQSYGVSDQNFLLIDIGASYTGLAVLHKGQLVFSRGQPVGGNFYNQGLQKKLGLGFEEAEDLKKGASENPPEVASCLEELNSSFCEEIYSNYEFYTSFFPEDKISEIYLTGGAAQTLGLKACLQSKFETPCEIFNPFQNLVLAPHLASDQESLQAYLPLSLGLALRTL